MTPEPDDWRGYLAGFHARRSGITEDLMADATDDQGRTAYAWLAEAVPPGGRVLDLACGSAPTAGLLDAAVHVGADLSREELRLAADRGATVVQADATAVPLPDGAVDAVVVSMSLQLVPLAATLREVRRVLCPEGRLVATVPTSRPMPLGDALRYARLCLALRVRGIRSPNDAALQDADGLLRAHGLHLESDDSVGFRYPVTSRAAADLLLDALYLPDVPPDRLAAGRRVVRGWHGSTTTVPVRRLVAVSS